MLLRAFFFLISYLLCYPLRYLLCNIFCFVLSVSSCFLLYNSYKIENHYVPPSSENIKNSKMVSKGITRLHRPYRSVKISSSAGSRHSRNAIPPSCIHSGSLSSMKKYTAKYTTQPMQIPVTTVLRFFSFCSFSKRICSSPIFPRQSTLIPCSVCAELVIKEYAWSYPANALHGPFSRTLCKSCP